MDGGEEWRIDSPTFGGAFVGFKGAVGVHYGFPDNKLPLLLLQTPKVQKNIRPVRKSFYKTTEFGNADWAQTHSSLHLFTMITIPAVIMIITVMLLL